MLTLSQEPGGLIEQWLWREREREGERKREKGGDTGREDETKNQD